MELNIDITPLFQKEEATINTNADAIILYAEQNNEGVLAVRMPSGSRTIDSIYVISQFVGQIAHNAKLDIDEVLGCIHNALMDSNPEYENKNAAEDFVAQCREITSRPPDPEDEYRNTEIIFAEYTSNGRLVSCLKGYFGGYKASLYDIRHMNMDEFCKTRNFGKKTLWQFCIFMKRLKVVSDIDKFYNENKTKLK